VGIARSQRFIKAKRHSGRNIWPGGEPTAALAVKLTNGDAPSPSPRFPVWKPRYLDGGAFPLGHIK
jgi:hypothetical protein